VIAEALARLLSTSALAGTRSSLTLLLLALAARLELFAGASSLAGPAWMTSNVGLGLLLALVVLEELAEQDEDLQALFDIAAYAIRGGAGALAAQSIQGVAELSGGLALPEWGSTLLGAGVAVGTHHLRANLHEQLAGLGDSLLSPRTWLAWLELGGVVGLAVAIVLAPVLALAFVVLAALGGAAVILAKRASEQRLFRRPCPHCGARVRVEASRCPSCTHPVPIQRWLR
jgi:hypothetical protein